MSELRELMDQIYMDSEIVENRIDEIYISNDDSSETEDDRNPSCSSICWNEHYSKATMVGCVLSLSIQLTGVNAMMFYSNTIFSDLEIRSVDITAAIGIVNFGSTLICLVNLFYFGRRTLIIGGYIGMTLMLTLLSSFCYLGSTIGIVASVMLFIFFFANSASTVVWLYNAEIMHDKAVALSTTIYWIGGLIISLSVPYIYTSSSVEMLFLIFACLTFANLIFIIVFLQETKEKTQ